MVANLVPDLIKKLGGGYQKDAAGRVDRWGLLPGGDLAPRQPDSSSATPAGEARWELPPGGNLTQLRPVSPKSAPKTAERQNRDTDPDPSALESSGSGDSDERVVELDITGKPNIRLLDEQIEALDREAAEAAANRGQL